MEYTFPAEATIDPATVAVAESYDAKAMDVACFVAWCIRAQNIKPQQPNTCRTISINLADLAGYDDITISSLAALAASEFFTPETIVRLLFQYLAERKKR
jgi:hypothetical protein